MLINLDEIRIGDRARKTFDPEKFTELTDSIKTFGLMHPVVVAKRDGGYELIAGHRRILAVRSLHDAGIPIHNCPTGQIIATVWGDVDEVRLKELELEENLRRHDLPWKETVRALAELHKLKTSLNPNWTQGDTAVAAGYAKGTSITKRLILAENLHRPAVASAANESQALRILEQELTAELRTKRLKSNTVMPEKIHLLCCDGETGIRQMLKPGSVDVIITDPPYGINAHEQGFTNILNTHGYDDTWEYVSSNVPRILAAATEVCKLRAHLYMFCAFERFAFWSEVLDQLGWSVWPRPILWVKQNYTPPKATLGPLYSYETIIFANRGDREVVKAYPDAIPIPQRTKGKQRAAQKPVELLVNLLERSTHVDDVVLDPFCGSGSVALAARKLGLTAYCFDIDPMAISLAQELISDDEEDPLERLT